MGSASAQDYAVGYTEDLLSFFGLNTKITAVSQDSVIELDIPSTHLNGFLIGHAGQNLRAFQHLLSLAVKRAGHDDITVVLDVAGYKKQLQQRLEQQANQVAQSVLAGGDPHEFEPMNAADRRIIHQAIGEVEGLSSESVGEGRDRHVVVKPLPKTKT